MVNDRQMYRVRSACKVIVKGSEMILTILSADYGLADKAEGALLKIFGYAAFAYEFAALPYLEESSEEIAGVALHFIGRGIDESDRDSEFLELSCLVEVYGYDLSNYEALLRIPGNYFPKPGERADYMVELLREFENGAKSAMKRLEPGNPELALNEVALGTERILSNQLYNFEQIGDDFFKNNYAFFQTIIEKQYNRENDLFG